LIVAAVLMGATGVMLVATGVWALTFKVFALNTKAVLVPRGVAVAGLVLVTLVVTFALYQERYFLSVAFGLLSVALSDPGGEYLPRLRPWPRSGSPVPC
jgi:hypothetical protein